MAPTEENISKLETTKKPVLDTKALNDAVNKVVDYAAGLLTKTAAILHVSEPTVIFLLTLVAIILVGVIAICFVRCSRKRRRKKRLLDEEGKVNDLYISDYDEKNFGYGRLSFSLNYNGQKKSLNVGVLCASSLKAQVGSPMDCYLSVKLVEPVPQKELESDDSMTARMMEAVEESQDEKGFDQSLFTHDFHVIGEAQNTPVIEDTNNPVFNEMITFKMTLNKVLNSWLLFDIIDRDLSGRDQTYGRVLFRFADLDSSNFVGSMVAHSVAIVPSPQIAKCSSEHAIPSIFRIPSARYIAGHSR